MLIFHGGVGRMRQHFADQFEAEGDGYLYRRFSKGSPIRVSAAERDAYVERFSRTLGRGMWIMLGGGMLLGLLLAVLSIGAKLDVPDEAASVGIGALVLYVGWTGWRAYTAPTHELRHRLPVGRERTGAEMQRVTLLRVRWRQLVLGAAGAVLLLVLKAAEWRTTSGKLWIGFGVLVLALLAVQAWRKRRFERDAR